MPTPADCSQCSAYGLAVCSALDSQELEQLERYANTLHVPANGVLARAGQPCRFAYSVTSGMLRLVRTLPDARRQVIDFMLPGDFIGLSEAQRYRHNIEAVAPSTTCIFDMGEIRMLRERFPALEHKMLERACTGLDDAQDAMLMLARLAPLERLAGFLLRLRKRYLANGIADPWIALPMGRSDIADHLGLTIETVSRSFTRLRTQQVIALPDPQRVDILDHGALERLAHALD
ncbi:cyclic nucleotide-binding domain-containing protein [Luteimonas aestuarii]|uniref:CRP-like protein Clp n=1 Tax=Luteimonas aestuarii TaxID=453837 RepID=A0A4R5TT10_9GAMM|nr:helix-turn-helix domain-containing protein [Luteimonas aestuarii]TDK22287.1 cyclic nucleotide-binding domain-containing protein [Luteimonas aestuarii]